MHLNALISPFSPLFFSFLALPREMRHLKCATLYTKQRTQHTKRQNQNGIPQNTMSHIGFRTIPTRVKYKTTYSLRKTRGVIVMLK